MQRLPKWYRLPAQEVVKVSKKSLLVSALIITLILTIFLTLHNLSITIINNSNNITTTVERDKNIPTGKVININTATANELDCIPGIGSVLSNSIIVYRNRHGPIKSIEELASIPGIGEKRIQSLKEAVIIR